MAQVLQFPRELFVWADETGSDKRTHIRRFGYIPCAAYPRFTPDFLHAESESQQLLQFPLKGCLLFSWKSIQSTQMS